MKKPFNFSYITPSLDWFEKIEVTLKPNEYSWYKLERRFGPTWWIIGMNLVDEPEYHTKETQIGEISNRDLLKFIEWCKTDVGNKITEINVIANTFNIFDEVKDLIKLEEESNE